MRILRSASFQGRYYGQEASQALHGEAAAGERQTATAEVGSRHRDQPGHAGVQPDHARAPEVRLVGDLTQREDQAVERMRRVGDRDRRARKDRAADEGSLPGSL